MASATRAPVRPDSGATSTAVSLEQVTRVFGPSPAVVRVDLRVKPGETILIRGANGAGKTTLLRIIATAISPTYGRGTVLGHDLETGRDAIRAATELMGHRARLYDDLTGLENLRFVCRLHGCDPERAGEALARVGLRHVADERVGGFSAGMRQRVALARLVLRSPALLLLDDPYAGLDAAGRDIVDAEVRRARNDGRTVILSAHEVSAEELATRVLTMDGGRIREGTTWA